MRTFMGLRHRAHGGAWAARRGLGSSYCVNDFTDESNLLWRHCGIHLIVAVIQLSPDVSAMLSHFL